MSDSLKKKLKRRKKLENRKNNQYWCRFCGAYKKNNHHEHCINKGFPNNMVSGWKWDGPSFQLTSRFPCYNGVFKVNEGNKMIDFNKHPVGTRLKTFVCDNCVHRAGLKAKTPSDSGVKSFYCNSCGHFGIGSKVVCEVQNWLVLKPLGLE